MSFCFDFPILEIGGKPLPRISFQTPLPLYNWAQQGSWRSTQIKHAVALHLIQILNKIAISKRWSKFEKFPKDCTYPRPFSCMAQSFQSQKNSGLFSSSYSALWNIKKVAFWWFLMTGDIWNIANINQLYEIRTNILVHFLIWKICKQSNLHLRPSPNH